MVARPIPRPQLPFLYPAPRANTLQIQLGRFLSTERKQRWRQKLRQTLRFHAYLWPSVALVIIVMMGVQQTKIERDYPTPREWSFWSRWLLRNARFAEDGEGGDIHSTLINWPKAGYNYQNLLERLESEKYDGKFLIQSDASGSYAESMGIAGFDISAKSEQWRRGYHQALMGAGRVAENLEGMCKRKGEALGRLYSRENVLGPENPRPKPLPWDKKKGHEKPPTVDEVEDAFPVPETFYMKVLTTKGFDNRQRLEAALANADWCDFKGLNETAQDTYDWAVDIAQSGLPAGVLNVIDARTGVIMTGREDAATENILKVCTALGVHHAKAGDVKRALPIFLSVLKARKGLPPSPLGATGSKKRVKEATSGPWPYLYALKDLIIEGPYPPPPPTGDERPYHTLSEACEEVGLMVYIGEILFSSSDSEREKGLGWTRDSVEAAEAIMWVMDEQQVDDGKERCRECLETGLQNWKDMSRQMSRLAAKKEKEIQQGPGLFGLGLGKAQQLEKLQREKLRWEEENAQIKLRRQKTLPLMQPWLPTRS